MTPRTSYFAATAFSLALVGCGDRRLTTPMNIHPAVDAGFDTAGSSLDTAGSSPDAGFADPTLMLVGSQLDDSYCALKAGGRLRCWSYDEFFDDMLAKVVAKAPPGLVRIAISETNHDDPLLCGIDAQGNGTCWGANTMTSLGGGVVATAMSRYGTCTLYQDGHVDCASIFTPLPSDRRYVQVAVGADFNLGLDDTGTPIHPDSLLQAPPGLYRKIAMFSSLGAALRDDGALVLVNWTTPLEMPGSFVELAFSYRLNLCGLDAAGEVTCFPLEDGQATPPPPPSGPFVHIEGSGRSLCGLRPTGTTTCWGDAQVRVPDRW